MDNLDVYQKIIKYSQAYDVSCDPIKRRKYDQTLWSIRPLMDILEKINGKPR